MVVRTDGCNAEISVHVAVPTPVEMEEVVLFVAVDYPHMSASGTQWVHTMTEAAHHHRPLLHQFIVNDVFCLVHAHIHQFGHLYIGRVAEIIDHGWYDVAYRCTGSGAEVVLHTHGCAVGEAGYGINLLVGGVVVVFETVVSQHIGPVDGLGGNVFNDIGIR